MNLCHSLPLSPKPLTGTTMMCLMYLHVPSPYHENVPDHFQALNPHYDNVPDCFQALSPDHENVPDHLQALNPDHEVGLVMIKPRTLTTRLPWS